jgi:hypothetical protein
MDKCKWAFTIQKKKNKKEKKESISFSLLISANENSMTSMDAGSVHPNGPMGSFDSRLMRLGAKEKSKKQRDLAAFGLIEKYKKGREKKKQTAGPIDKENTRGNRFLMRRGSLSRSCFSLVLSV